MEFDHQHRNHNRLFKFHLRMRHEKEGAPAKVPKGLVGIRVGTEGETKQRFTVPVEYLKHPLFVGLLKEAEEVYGFNHPGPITIPCRVDYFRYVQGIIESDTSATHHRRRHHHRWNLFAGCFRA